MYKFDDIAVLAEGEEDLETMVTKMDKVWEKNII